MVSADTPFDLEEYLSGRSVNAAHLDVGPLGF